MLLATFLPQALRWPVSKQFQFFFIADEVSHGIYRALSSRCDVSPGYLW